MQDWDECPEAMGPQSEGAINNVQYGDPGQVRIGPIPRQMPQDMMERERAAEEHRFEVRQRVERAAIAAGATALESGATADRILREAADAAQKASLR